MIDLITRYQGGNEDRLPRSGQGRRPHSSARPGASAAVRPSRRRPAVKRSCLPMSMWDRGTAALATLRAAPQTGHLGRGAGLIDEHQSAVDRDRVGFRARPAGARRRQGAPCSAACAVFFKADPMAIEEPPHRAGPDRQVALFQQRLARRCPASPPPPASRGRALDPSRPPVTASRIGRGAGPSGATHQPRMALDTLTPNRAAAPRRDDPASTASIGHALMRKSSER